MNVPHIVSHHVTHRDMKAVPSVKIELHKKKKTDTDGYLRLLVYVPGTRRYVPKSLGYKIPAEYWDQTAQVVKKGYPNYTLINAAITTKKNAADTAFQLDAAQGQPITRETVRRKIKKTAGNTGSFISFYDDYVTHMETPGKDGRLKYSNSHLVHFRGEYDKLIQHAGKNVRFEDITVAFLKGYESFLRAYVADTTLNTKMKRLKEVVDNAIAQELIRPKQIAGYKWPGYTAPDRPYLTLEQTEAIAAKLYKGEFDYDIAMQTIAAYFLVECYAGIRFSDWSRFTIEKLINKERLKVRAKKNGEPVYIPLDKSRRLRTVLDYIKANDLQYNLSSQYTNRVLKVVGKFCKIPLELTTHVGRHTCATLLLEMGYSHAYISEVLGISEGTVKTYAKTTRTKMNKEYEEKGGL